jgi:hypothetical protein
MGPTLLESHGLLRLSALSPLPAAEIAAGPEAHLAEIVTPRDDLTLVVIKRQEQHGCGCRSLSRER